jgi:hypothetical protein
MLSTKTSRMVAVTNPIRWSFEVVDVFFGEVRPRRSQTIALKGDMIRDLETGVVFRLKGREGDMILIEEI